MIDWWKNWRLILLCHHMFIFKLFQKFPLCFYRPKNYHLSFTRYRKNEQKSRIDFNWHKLYFIEKIRHFYWRKSVQCLKCVCQLLAFVSVCSFIIVIIVINWKLYLIRFSTLHGCIFYFVFWTLTIMGRQLFWCT